MENSITWIGLSATLIFAIARGTNITESWTAIEQPDLKQELEMPTILQTESWANRPGG